MLYPQQIYDLDTITLEEKTEELERVISQAAAGPSKQWLHTLELAKLEIQERRSIEQFGLDLEQDIQLFDRYCMYPVETGEEPQPVSLLDNKEERHRELTESTRTLVPRTHKKVDCSMLEVIKRTKINTGALVIGRANVAPIVNLPFKKKRFRQEAKTQAEERHQRASIRERANSQKKIPLIPVPPREHNRQKAIGQSESRRNKRPTIEKTEKNSCTLSTIPIKNASKVQSLSSSGLRESLVVRNETIMPVPEIKDAGEKKPVPVLNNIKFIENDIYSDSEEEPDWKQDVSSACSQESPHKLESGRSTVELDSAVEPEKHSTIGSLVIEEKVTPASEVNSARTTPAEVLAPAPEGQPVVIKDAIDYFRLTVINRAKKISAEESKAAINESIPEIIAIEEAATTEETLIVPEAESIKEEIVEVEREATAPPTPISSSRAIAGPQPLRPPPYNGRKTQSSLAAHFKLPSPIVKIISELPPIVTEYHNIIPTFNHLFHPKADVVPLLWELCDMLKQHLAKVSAQEHFRPNLAGNMLQFQTYVNGSMNKIRLYGSKVDLDLSRFELRDNLARMRASGQLQPPVQREVYYYRVVKTKQEVYDIMSSTFTRTDNWAELPHGMNLKNSWNMLWTWAKPQIEFAKLFYFQKVNHFPHNKHISRKDMLKKNIEKVKRLGARTQQLFDIMPESYLLPGENTLFLERYMHHKQKEGLRNLWIMKPIGMSRGRGISLVSSLDQVIFSEPVVLQKYLKNPLLLDGYKFDMRIYVLLTSVNPLEVYLYRQGFARLSTEKYTLDESALKNNFIHLTNFAIQRENYTHQGFSLGGTKLSLKMLRERLRLLGIEWEPVWLQVKEIVLKSCIAIMNEIPPNPNCFELFGYDIIIDCERKCWLLEVNSSPSLQREFLLDEIIKQQLIDDTVELLDVPQFDRKRFLEVLERRAMEIEGRKSLINPTNNTVLQLNRDLHYILHGKPLTEYGKPTQPHPNYEMLAPSSLYYSLIKSVQSYKISSLIRKQ